MLLKLIPLQHLALVGTILPFHHEAWDWMMPPSGWGCDCSVRPTDKEATAMPVKPADFNNLFANNPAKTATFVDTKETPYYKHTDKSLRKKVAKEGIRLAKDETAEEVLYKGQKGGYLKIVPQNKNEREKNLKTYKIMADNGGKYTLLKESKVEGQKNPDAFNYKTGMFSDAKHPKGESGKNAIQNSIREASKQGVQEVIIRMDREYTTRSIYDGFKAALQENRAKNIELVILIRKDRKPLYLEVGKITKRFTRK